MTSARAVIAAICLTVAPLAVASGQASPQAELECGPCYDNLVFGLWSHAFYWGNMYSMNADCHAWNSCHSNIQADACTSWHWQCGVAAAGSADRVILAVRDANARAVILEIQAGMATYVAERGSVQVNGCSGSVLLNVPISASLAVAVTSALDEDVRRY